MKKAAKSPNRLSASAPVVQEDQYVLRLYITGPTSVSARAIVNARRVCDANLKGRYRLEVLNVADHVSMATADQVIAAPTLIKLLPLPVKRFIGDMSNTERLIKGLDVSVA
ncbi:MAG TPA: circadian clock KaiB family protein [Steroidobacteraceae bacterium]|nr:circadian clock KaiB family protein [Steroidobacteraceae bacterium]